MSERANVGDRVKEFFQSFGKKKQQMSDETSNFRADELLRSKMSTDDASLLPMVSQPRQVPQEHESPGPTLQTNQPQLSSQIRPPTFSPLVNLKHMTPFEHNERPQFRVRQSSAPPPRRQERESSSSPSPSPVIQSARQENIEKPRPLRVSQLFQQPPAYSWDGWEQPAFVQVPVKYDGRPRLAMPQIPSKNGRSATPDGVLLENGRKPSYAGIQSRQGAQPSANIGEESYYVPPLPPPLLYYDPYSGQYVAAPTIPSGYDIVGRHAHTLNRRHRRKSHHHHKRSCTPHMDIANYSTYNPTKPFSTSVPPSEASFDYRSTLQTQPQATPEMQQQKVPAVMSQNDRFEDEIRVTQKKRLISSGTTDTPSHRVETLNSKRNSVLTPITPVSIPQTMFSNQNPNRLSAEILSPITDGNKNQTRYTSDVVRSMNRMIFKMGRKESAEGMLSPKDSYQESLNITTRSPQAPKVSSNGEVQGARKLSVMELVKKYSQMGESGSSTGSTGRRHQLQECKLPSRVPADFSDPDDTAEILGDVSYTDDIDETFRK
ncbi:unnamed protein product [Mesocestoides corti]|uniref:Uncharacterized protein n=1 Tax=Mesocestoides corti TaxID=53468 RepID=A0A0R3UM55_MESCO|nr:unnamed protein product [Mesocestoides corti]